MNRSNSLFLSLMFLLIGLTCLCGAGANLLGQAPGKEPGKITGVKRPAVPAIVLLGASGVTLAIGFLILYRNQKPKS